MMGLRVAQYYIFVIMLTKGVSSDEIRLDQSPAVVKKPGETVKISCKIHGFVMTSYYIHRIRQKPGKALEWLGRINAGSNQAIYAESVKNQLTFTEDVSASTQFCVLEWIKSIYYDGDIYQKDSLKDKFVISRDTSSNTVTLRGQNMQTEDTAVYYCAPHPHSDTTSCSQADTKTSEYSWLYVMS
ncbi:hypothetical protein QTP70_018315 [Hemibagrus guttatus]|uniref:Ig-like domain-containing protein n=1 Tax=Hemibagrus guttatus TaxID=175788 RepID=A0AAE0PS26_9TELE|nr:hypothetical protein QTP70_018315 [Hemibagrus guttatus]